MVSWTLPCLAVRDLPRFRWRGMMLDVSRHFFPKEFIKRYIDLLAFHKLNTFHWHLSDDQGWRIEIKKYPRLTEVGAWRVDHEDQPWTARPAQQPGEKASVGGFYTQEDIREIVAYAASRFVTVVPEIEMPAHALAALAAYPEYSCSGGPFTVPAGSIWPNSDIFCVGNDATFAFLTSILDEVISLFPGPYVHIGGDEADKTNWKKCPKCQARIRAEGLKDEAELQSYFTRRIETFLISRGRRLIGWDEIIEGGLAPEATVMSWRGMAGGEAAARQDHDVVMSPTSHCYFDYYQGAPAGEPSAIGGFLPLSKVYAFEPIPAGLSAAQASHILGLQANLWTEYVPEGSHAEYLTLPRVAALCEAAWSATERRSWPDFCSRLPAYMRRLDRQGFHYSRSAYRVDAAPQVKPSGRVYIRLASEIAVPQICYTLDGSAPGAAALRYRRPIRLNRSLTVKAVACGKGQPLGLVSEQPFVFHLALGKASRLTHAYSDRYPAGGAYTLTDGVRGTTFFDDGHWQGFEGQDLEAVLDLGRVLPLHRLSAGFLQNSNSWIFLPSGVEFSVSADGKNFQVVGRLSHEVPPLTGASLKKEFSVELASIRARFVRLRAQSLGTCPVGHPAAGQPAWLFADELIVE